MTSPIIDVIILHVAALAILAALVLDSRAKRKLRAEVARAEAEWQATLAKIRASAEKAQQERIAAHRWVVDTVSPGWAWVKERNGLETSHHWLPMVAVHAPRTGERDADSGAVCAMALAVAAFLNGKGQLPAWVADLERMGEDHAVGDDGSALVVWGPLVPLPAGLAIAGEDDSQASRDRRARLMDRLMGVQAGKEAT